jgi:Nucleotidyl transferase AbiEii toxin, Type IV TA system
MHTNTVSPQLLSIMHKVSNAEAFSDFRLCEGTALSLQIGHRLSVDADFITQSPIDKPNLIKLIIDTFPTATDIYSAEYGIFLKVHDIKVDFLSWNLPFIRPAIKLDGITTLHTEEIIAMKIFAILQRGEKKDYMDIATLLNQYSLNQIISFYQERHKGSDAAVVLRFLSSFSDIEKQPDPVMLNGLTWQDAKEVIISAVKNYLIV